MGTFKFSRIFFFVITFSVLISFTACDMFKVGLGDAVDVTPPELTITAPGNDPIEYKNVDFTFTGIVQDDRGVKDVIISWPGGSANASINETSWTASVPISSVTSRGQVLFEVQATDNAGKSTSPAYRTVVVDDIPPSVLITTPQIYNPGPENSNYIVIGGEAWDDSPIENVTVEIFDPTSPASPIVTQVADGDRTWSTRITLSDVDFVNSGIYSYRVSVEDKAGNINSYAYHSADIWALLPQGTLFPAMTDIGKWDQNNTAIDISAGDGSPIFTDAVKLSIQQDQTPATSDLTFTFNSDKDKPQITLSNLDPSKPVNENAIGQNVPIYASATDDKEGIEETSAELKIFADIAADPETATADLTVSGSNFNSPGDGLYTSFDFELSNGNKLDPGQYLGRIYIEDKKGVSSISTFLFLVDKGAPNISEIAPSSTYAGVDGSGNVNLMVTVQDDNPDASVTANATDTSDSSVIPGITATIQGAETAISGAEGTIYESTYLVVVPGPVPNQIEVAIIVEDTSGLKNTRSIVYDIDRDAPTLNITVPTNSSSISGSAVTVAGTAADVTSSVYQVYVAIFPGSHTTPVNETSWVLAEGNTSWSKPITLSDYTEGPLSLFAKAIDLAGNEGAVSYVNFSYDLADPVLTITQGETDYYAITDFSLDGSMSDTNNISTFDILVSKDGGTEASESGYPATINLQNDTWTYSKTVDPAGADDGRYDYRFVAVDQAGKTVELAKTIYVDTTAPELVVSNLADGDSVNSSTYTVKGLASDFSGLETNGSGNQIIEYQLNAGAWQELEVQKTGNWELVVSGLSEGAANTIIFRATDINGLINTLPAINFGLDLALPALTISNKATIDSSLQNADFAINGTTSDANGIQLIEITTDGGTSWTTMESSPGVPYTSSDATVINWTYIVTVPGDGSEEGNHLVQIRTIDNFNKERMDSLFVTYDTTGPGITVSNLNDGDFVETASFTIQGTATDVSGIASVQYNLNSGGWLDVTGTNSWSQAVSGLAEGAGNTIQFRATDNTGNPTSTAVISFGMDISNPALSTTNKATYNNTWTTTAPYTLNGTSSDANGITSLEISTDGGSTWTTMESSPGVPYETSDATVINWTYDIALADGSYTILIKATDTYNKTTTDTINSGIDTVIPTVAISNINSDGSTELAIADFTALGSAADATSGVVKVEYNLNGAGWLTAIGTTSWSVSLSGLTDGLAQTFAVRSTDQANSVSGVTTYNFDVDFAAPGVTETTSGISDESTVYKNTDVSLGGSVSDGNGIASVIVDYSKDGGALTNLLTDTSGNGTWATTLGTALGDGSYAVTITATDNAGKTSVINRNIVIDTVNPVPSITLPPGGSYITTATYTASGIVTDNTPLTSVEYQLNGGGWASVLGTDTWNQSLSGLTEGSYTFEIRATDSAGNSATTSSTFTVDLANPVVTETNMGVSSAYVNAAFTLSGNLTDSLDIANLTITQKKNAEAAVEIYNNDYAGASDTSQAWSVASLPSGGVAEGVYLYVITVTDGAGRTASIERTITLDNQAPNLQITSILPILTGNVVNGKVVLNANTSDSSGITGVQYFIIDSGGAAPAYDDVGAVVLPAPYNATLDTTDAGTFTDTQDYDIYVIARDYANNNTSTSITITVDQSSDTPSAAIDSPADASQIGADNKVRGTFSDDDGVAAGDANLYIRKVGAGSWTQKPYASGSSAGQLISWNIDVTDVVTAGGDGSYEMYFETTDDATLKDGLPAETGTTATQTFLYDKNAPTVSASITTAPVQTAYASTDVITFSWTATDFSGIASQTVDIDGGTTGLGSVTNPSGDNFEITYTVPSSGITSGYKTLTLVVEDNVGRSTTRTENILVDIDNPVVENAYTVEPTFVGFTANGAFTLKGTASDNRGLASVSIQLSDDGGTTYGAWTGTTLSNGAWSYNVADSSVYVAAAGDLYFKVKAADNAGNESAEQTFTLAVDQSADKATVSILSPVAATVYGTTVQISGTAKDDDALKGDTVLAADSIEIEYWDTALPAVVTSINPDTISGSGQNATFNHTLTLTSGTWEVRARATDDNAVVGDWTSAVQFTVNAGAPNLTVTTSVDTFISNPSLTLNGTVSDGDGVDYVRIRVNGGAWNTANAGSGSWGPANTSDTWSYTLSLGSDGLKTIEVQTADTSAYIANEQLTTTLDQTAPTGTFDVQFKDNPSGSLLDTTQLNGVVQITGTVTELNLADTNPIEIRIAEWNGVSEDNEILAYTAVNNTFVWNYVWDTSALTDRQYNIQLRVTDKAGNVTDTITKVVTTDQSSDTPSISQAFVAAPTSNDAGNNVLGALLKVSGTLSDDDGFVGGAVNIYLDGSATPIAATNTSGTTATWEYTWASLAQGEHYLTIEATDRNGAQNTVGPTYFLVDTANPSVSIATPAIGAKIKAGTLSITGTASDAGGLGTNALEISLRHSNASSSLEGLTYYPVVQGDNSFSQDVTIDAAVLDGTLFIDLVLTDRAGKQATLTRAVTIDITEPSLALNYPASGAYINGLVSITGTADDLNGLADVTFEILNPANHSLPVTSLTRNSATLAAWEFLFNSDSYSSATYGIDVNADGKLWKVYFRLAAEDNSGNVTELKDGADYPHFFIDTDGDKPTVSVTQPKNGDTIGGFINMFGTATDDDGPVMQVEVRIDFNGNNNFTDSRDINNDDADGNPATGITLGADQDILGTTVRIGDPAEPWEDESAWYVVAVSNNSWTIDLNTNNELYASNTGGTGDIQLQVRTRDQFGLASEIIERTITLDETFPRIENVTPADQTYQNDSFNMVAEFGDDVDLDLGSISEVRININKTGWQTLSAQTGPTPYTMVADFADPQNGWDLTYPIDTNTYFPASSGIMYIDLLVKDEAGYQNQKTYTYYVDNQPPSASWSDRVGAPDGSNLANGMITVNGTDKTYIEGNYDDTGSVNGISHIEAYFVDTTTDEVLNIKASGTWAGATSTESIDIETYDLGTNTWSSGTDPAGVYVLHTDLGDNYVMKIDYPNEMSSLTFGADVDSDGYIEFMGISSGAPRFRSYFDSQYLPDGIIELHYVAYDLAGNYVHKMREVFIANNGPQADRIQVGSDINANTSVANTGNVTEIADYYYPTDSVDRTDAMNIKNNLFYIGIEGSDPNGANQGVKQIFVDAYDVTGVTYLGQAAASTLNPTNGDYSTSFTIVPGSGIWDDPSGTYTGVAQKTEYLLKVVIRDNDDINLSRWVKIAVLNPADTTNPILTLNPLSQSDQDTSIGHLELQADTDAGVWTTISTEYGDNDPKASGEVIYTGTVTDENRITQVSVTSENNPAPTLASWNGSELVSDVPASFTIDTQVLDENGHTITFTYKWDTSDVAGVAGLNKTISFGAQDAGTNGATPGTDQVDVVPYISSIVRDSNNYNTNRSKYGKYPVQQSETNILINGFNILVPTTQTATNWVRLYSAATAGNADGSALTVEAAPIPSKTAFEISSNAASLSGYLRLSVNDIEAINNINDNNLDWNKEDDGNGIALTKWSDDRYLILFEVGDFFDQSTDPEHPSMDIDTSTSPDRLYGTWSNYAASSAYTAGPDSATGGWPGRDQIFSTYDPPEYTDTYLDADGDIHTVILENYVGGTTSTAWGFLASYINGGTREAIEDLGDDWSTNSNHADGLDEMLYQFRNARITAIAGTNDQYISYYDVYARALKYSRATNGAATFTSINNPTNGATVVDGIDDFDDDPTDSGDDVGLYSDIQIDQIGGTDATGTHIPVIVYYDTTNRQLKIARGLNSQPSGTAQWYIQVIPNTSFTGQYVSMKMDSSGNLHITAYKNSTGDLVYIKADNVDGAGGAGNPYVFSTPVVVDTEGSVGNWADLTLDSSGSPLISYINLSGAGTFDGLKYAYVESGTGTSANDWETVTVPGGSSVEAKRSNIVWSDDSNWNGNIALGYASTTFDIVYVKQQIP